MNKDTVNGKWTEVKGRIKARWGKLTDNDLTLIEGRAEELGGLLQQRYGLAREQAEKDSKAFLDSCDWKSGKAAT